MNVFRPALREEVEYIAQHLREDDRRELEAGGGPPLTAVLDLPGRVYCASRGGTPTVIMGIQPDGRVWLLGTPEVRHISLALIRECSQWKRRWLDEFDVLWNVVDDRNIVHKRWLDLMGFDFGQIKFDINGHSFTYFQATRD